VLLLPALLHYLVVDRRGRGVELVHHIDRRHRMGTERKRGRGERGRVPVIVPVPSVVVSILKVTVQSQPLGTVAVRSRLI